MTRFRTSGHGDPLPDDSDPAAHSPTSRGLRAAGELVLGGLVVLSPWPFACVEPAYELPLSLGVCLLTSLWAAHAVVTRRFTFRPDVVSVSLAGLILLSAVQLVPLPEPVVGVLSPTRLRWHRELVPERLEMLPGEAGPASRPSLLPLTVDPSSTRTFLAHVLGVLLVYAAARNWLASRAAFRRLAWAMVGNGAALAGFAVGQFFSSPRTTMYWSVVVEGAPFGPFVCRNHYPDYAVLCAALGIGLLLPPARKPDDHPRPGDPAGGVTPQGLGLVCAVGLILASIPFSLSRGGMIATVAGGVAAWLLTRVGDGRSRGVGPGTLALASAVAAGTVLVVWLGTAAIETRLATLQTGEAAESRLPMWRYSAGLAPGVWAAGTGNGTFIWAEPTVRPAGAATIYYENAHNEYLEALVEGGAARLALTLSLAGGALWVVGRGFLRRRERSAGPLLIGVWFGLAAGVFHAVGDFGDHMPAVAVAVAAVAGFAVAGATDAGFVPPRVRVRRVRAGEAVLSEPAPRAAEAGAEGGEERGFVVRGWAAGAVGLAVAGIALLVAFEVRERYLADRLSQAGEAAYWNAVGADPLAVRAEYYDARAVVRPDDPVVQFDAAQAHLDAAIADTWEAGAAVGGVGAGFVAAPLRFPPPVVDRHVVPALRHLRAARAANPLAPRVHARLGLYAQYFAAADQPAAYFARAKSLLPGDPDIWFASGREALRRGDEAAAWADWKQSLVIGPQHRSAIVRLAGGRLTPAELRAKVLPDDPVALMAAAAVLYPDRPTAAAGRRSFAEAAAACANRPGLTADQWAAVAAAADELDRPADAAAAWRAAVDLAPNRVDLRDHYASWLEANEQYEEAVRQLELVEQKSPGNTVIRDRIDAAKHGLKLQRAIAGN